MAIHRFWGFVGISFVILVALGCTDSTQTRDYCSSEAALPMADASDSTDYRLNLDTASTFAVFTAGDQDAGTEHVDTGLKAGHISFHTEDPACVAFTGHPCSIELRQFALQFGAMDLPTSVANADVHSMDLSAEVPITLVDVGSGYVLYPETSIRLNASIENHVDARTITLGDQAIMNIDIPNRLLGLNLEMPFGVRVSQNGSCASGNSRLTLIASAEAQWNLPSQ